MKKQKKEKHFIRKPVYDGGSKAMKAFIKAKLVYPPEALKRGIEGTVALKYTIDHLGKVTEVKIISPLGYGCDEEAIRLVKGLSFSVEKIRGRRILFHKNIQIHFKMTRKARATKAPSISYQYQFTPSQAEVPSSGYRYTIRW